MASYLVSTPGNPNFSGKVYGIPFTNGRAFVSDQTVDPRLGWTADQIGFSMKHDFGYDVLEVASPANLPVPALQYPGNIPPEAVYAESLKGIPVLKEVPAAEPMPEPEPEPEPTPEPEPEAPAFAEASPAPAEEPAPASTKEKRSRRRKGAEDSEQSK